VTVVGALRPDVSQYPVARIPLVSDDRSGLYTVKQGYCPRAIRFQARTGLVVFPDRIAVASARELSRILRLDIRGHQYTIFDMSRTVYLEDSAAVMMGELTGMAMARQSRTIVVAGMSQSVSDTVHSMGALDRVPAGNFAADAEEAKRIIRPLLLADRQGS